tara:strand:+ start:2600 stop:3997 length:1398 start_codon:yes stop_codon:yes gene_type:complete
MAVKFSDFTPVTKAADVTELVGYISSSSANIRIDPSNLDTSYNFSTTNGATPVLTLAGTKTGETIADSVVTLSSSNATVLNGSGGNAISIDSTAYSLAATDNADPAQNTPVVLTGSGGGDSGTDTVNLIGSSGVSITSSSNTITFAGSGGSGSVTSVGLTETGTALTITSTSTNPITGAGSFDIAGAGTSSQVILGDLSLAALPSSYDDWRLEGDQGTTEIITTGNTVNFIENTDLIVPSVTGTQVGGGVKTTAKSTDQLLFDQISELKITVPASPGNKFYVDGAETPTIVLPRGFTYEFNQDDSTNNGHPIVIGTASGSSPLTVGIQYYGSTSSNTLTEVAQATYANTTNFNTYATRRVRIRITQNTPGLYYYCAVHGIGQGGAIAFGAASGLATRTVDQTTIINSTTATVNLSVTPTSEAYTDMYVSGVYQNKSVYSLSSNIITLDGGAYFPNGSIVEVVSIT